MKPLPLSTPTTGTTAPTPRTRRLGVGPNSETQQLRIQNTERESIEELERSLHNLDSAAVVTEMLFGNEQNNNNVHIQNGNRITPSNGSSTTSPPTESEDRSSLGSSFPESLGLRIPRRRRLSQQSVAERDRVSQINTTHSNSRRNPTMKFIGQFYKTCLNEQYETMVIDHRTRSALMDNLNRQKPKMDYIRADYNKMKEKLEQVIRDKDKEISDLRTKYKKLYETSEIHQNKCEIYQHQIDGVTKENDRLKKEVKKLQAEFLRFPCQSPDNGPPILSPMISPPVPIITPVPVRRPVPVAIRHSLPTPNPLHKTPSRSPALPSLVGPVPVRRDVAIRRPVPTPTPVHKTPICSPSLPPIVGPVPLRRDVAIRRPIPTPTAVLKTPSRSPSLPTIVAPVPITPVHHNKPKPKPNNMPPPPVPSAPIKKPNRIFKHKDREQSRFASLTSSDEGTSEEEELLDLGGDFTFPSNPIPTSKDSSKIFTPKKRTSIPKLNPRVPENPSDSKTTCSSSSGGGISSPSSFFTSTNSTTPENRKRKILDPTTTKSDSGATKIIKLTKESVPNPPNEKTPSDSEITEVQESDDESDFEREEIENDSAPLVIHSPLSSDQIQVYCNPTFFPEFPSREFEEDLTLYYQVDNLSICNSISIRKNEENRETTEMSTSETEDPEVPVASTSTKKSYTLRSRRTYTFDTDNFQRNKSHNTIVTTDFYPVGSSLFGTEATVVISTNGTSCTSEDDTFTSIQKKPIEVPSWRINSFNPIESNPDSDFSATLDDAAYLKRHAKAEHDEKSRKRKDEQRAREEAYIEHLKYSAEKRRLRTQKKEVKKRDIKTVKSSDDLIGSAVHFTPNTKDIQAIEIGEDLPASIFGIQLKHRLSAYFKIRSFRPFLETESETENDSDNVEVVDLDEVNDDTDNFGSGDVEVLEEDDDEDENLEGDDNSEEQGTLEEDDDLEKEEDVEEDDDSEKEEDDDVEKEEDVEEDDDSEKEEDDDVEADNDVEDDEDEEVNLESESEDDENDEESDSDSSEEPSSNSKRILRNSPTRQTSPGFFKC